MDSVKLLSHDQKIFLDSMFAAVEDSVGSQIVVVITPSLHGLTIEEYSIRIAESIQPGRAGYNDGILITLAYNERLVRIDLGYGLECIISDYASKQIIDSLMIPEFVKESYYNGLFNGANRLASMLFTHQEEIGRCKYNPDFIGDKVIIPSKNIKQ